MATTFFRSAVLIFAVVDSPGRRFSGGFASVTTTLKSFASCVLVVVCEGFQDRKSTRLNSSHANISYAVFCLKKKKKDKNVHSQIPPDDRRRRCQHAEDCAQS